jgi:hypothetical protein
LRNYNTPANPSSYNFNKLTSYTGYIYFDRDGQITADAYWTGANTSGVPTLATSTTSANQSTEVGVNMSGSTLNANQGKSGMPLQAAQSPPPSSTYYTCTITTIQPTLSTGSTSSMYLVKLKFSWPSNAPVANQHTRAVLASISNNTN